MTPRLHGARPRATCSAAAAVCLLGLLSFGYASEDEEDSSCTLLRPGEAHVVDGFLTEAELEGFARVMGGGKPEKSRKYGTDFEEVHPSAEELPFVWSVMEKMRGYAEKGIKSQSQHTDGPWAFKGSYYPDLFTLRRYGAMEPMKPHVDTGSYGRCLSGELHLGHERGPAPSTSPAERGGRLQLYGCRGGCRPWKGWTSRERESFGPQPPENLSEAEDLELLREVDHEPGRLVLFLAETPHGVSRVMPSGERNVLFVWFSCEATLSSGASSLGHVALVDLLLQGRADVGEPDVQGQRPLAHAAYGGHVPIIRQLLAHRADVDAADSRGLQPLHLATTFDRVEAAEELLGANANPAALTLEGDSPSSLAALGGSDRVLARLLDLRAVSLDGSEGRDVLSTAIRAGHVPVAEVLLARDADVNRLDGEAGRPLFWAAWTGHVAHVERLLKGRADPEAWSNYRGQSMLPIQVAAMAGHEAVVRLLLAAGPSLPARVRAAKMARGSGHGALATLIRDWE